VHGEYSGVAILSLRVVALSPRARYDAIGIGNLLSGSRLGA
jgi:hypothetical protein